MSIQTTKAKKKIERGHVPHLRVQELLQKNNVYPKIGTHPKVVFARGPKSHDRLSGPTLHLRSRASCRPKLNRASRKPKLKNNRRPSPENSLIWVESFRRPSEPSNAPGLFVILRIADKGQESCARRWAGMACIELDIGSASSAR